VVHPSAPVGRTIVMVTSSYPRFPGDAIGTFMKPIAQGVASRGYDVHVVAPWHPLWRHEASEAGVRFHLFRYAPLASMNVFGYAAALRADVQLRLSAVAIAPIAILAGCRAIARVARRQRASIIHAHWVIPSGVMAAAVSGRRPLIISLHGSDVFVAERHGLARKAASAAFRRAAWITACSEDLRNRAVRLGAPPDRTTVVPYGVDVEQFRPDPEARARGRATLHVANDVPVVLAFGRLVEKKGFAYLIDAVISLKQEYPGIRLLIAGQGDLEHELRARAVAAGVADQVQFLGVVPQHTIPMWLAACDVAVVPSVRDEAGNVDGLPNTVLEIMASGAPLVATRAGGIGMVATDGETARLTPQRDPNALARVIADLLRQPSVAAGLGRRAREAVCRDYSWARVAGAFDEIYERVVQSKA
jgi:glycosyltransferase involved in cell wall biosynthesis